VAAQISSPTPLTELYARQAGDEHNELDPGVAVAELAGLFLAAVGTPGLTKTQKLQRIGEIALATRTVPEPKRRAVIAGRLPCHDWPDRTLRITAVDVGTGELVVFDRDSGVGLVDAVAASCAVPGVWPPVTIDARRYMDGGVNSTVNIATAAECDRVVVLVPTPRNVPSPFGNAAEEIEAFPSATLAIFADEASLAAFGRNPMDPGCRIPSAIAGRAQGRGVAAAVAEFLAV
jgi:NTE family protein